MFDIIKILINILYTRGDFMSEQNIRPENLNWDNLGFSYRKTDYRYISHFKDGTWDEGQLVEDNILEISEAATALHYGQAAFEGLKAFRTKDGDINIFRPIENAKRLRKSAERLLMAPFPEKRFIQAVQEVVKANEDWIPPYGHDASLYIRPLLIGSGNKIGVDPADEYIFTIFVLPVGSYFGGSLKPSHFVISDFDRAAPKGTGAAKAAGNYGSSLMPASKAKDAGYSDAIYLDPSKHEKIEEIGSSNFFAITKDGTFVTPDSPSILPGITRHSLMQLAEEELGLKVEHREVYVNEFENFVEAGSCGTAAVITPIASITYDDKKYEFYSDTEAGPITQKLYDLLIGIQLGEIDAPAEDWIVKA